jgi:hypothetical protein
MNVKQSILAAIEMRIERHEEELRDTIIADVIDGQEVARIADEINKHKKLQYSVKANLQGEYHGSLLLDILVEVLDMES